MITECDMLELQALSSRCGVPSLQGWQQSLIASGKVTSISLYRSFGSVWPGLFRLRVSSFSIIGVGMDSALEDTLAANLSREIEGGHTLTGPHRADLRLRYEGSLAADILSRGQQKLVVCALRVAQGQLLARLSNRKCVFLIDDLPSELDGGHREALCGLLEDLQSQVFVTCVDHNDLMGCWSDTAEIKLFHVEHGTVKAQPSGG